MCAHVLVFEIATFQRDKVEFTRFARSLCGGIPLVIHKMLLVLLPLVIHKMLLVLLDLFPRNKFFSILQFLGKEFTLFCYS